MPNIGKDRLEIFESHKNQLEYLYSQNIAIWEIANQYIPQLDEAKVPVHDRNRFMRALLNNWGIKRDEPAPKVIEDTNWESEQIQFLSLKLEKERQSRKISDTKFRELLKQRSLEARITDMLYSVLVAADPIEVPEIVVSEHNSTSEHTLVALLSDLHIGEVVKPEQVGGLDEYNLEVFDRRINKWADNLLYLTELKRTRLDVPRLEIFGLGDFVSGEIHDELVRTNEVHIIEQVYYAVKHISEVLLRLAPHYEHITFTGVVGNHGRNARKPYAKDKQTLSFDFLIYQMLGMVLKNQKTIEFIIPESFFHYREVLDYRFILMHGDGIRSSLGVPVYGLNRMRSQLRDIIGREHQFDHIVLGHYHHFIQTDFFTINPSMKGTDEYAVSGFFGANRPTQVLLTLHEEHGIVSTEHIFVDDSQANVADFTPPLTWAEKIKEL